jgi:hypothetical protein
MSMMINISSSQYRLLKGTLTLIEMTPSLLQEIESAISDPLLPVADWAKMLLDQDLLSQQVEVRDDTAQGLQITRTGKFLLLLADLNLLRMLDNTPLFVSLLPPVVIQVTDKELQADTLNVHLPQQKLFRIRVLDKGGRPAANKIVSYQNIRDVPTGFYTVKSDENGEVLLCGVNAGSYRVSSPECDPVHVVVEDSDLDDREIILRPRPES